MGQPIGSLKPTSTDFRKKGTGNMTLPESKYIMQIQYFWF